MKIKWTNKYNYPEILADALKYDDYDVEPSANIISVTSLISTPRIRKYMLDDNYEATIDVSDMVWSSLGRAMHKILESSGSKYIKEVRTEKDFNGTIVTGKFDYYDNDSKTLGDFKLVSKYQREPRTEWIKQLNILSYLLSDIRQFTVNKLEITAIARDFLAKDKYSSQFGGNPGISMQIEKWDKATTEMYIRKRLLIHSNYKDYICNDEDRWNTIKYAVTMPNAQRSKHNFDNYVDALEYLEPIQSKGYIIEQRKSGDVFCKDYCPVRSICEINKEREKSWN
jgi:hypothetical protein